jgi:TRAP-type C4-dicarboxylate transport system permease small subunit
LSEFLVLIAIVVALMAAITVLFSPFRWVLGWLEQLMLAGSVLIVLFVLGFVCAEVFMRYVFNAPIPGHLEGSELLMPIIVFLAISYTQRVRGHVGMDLVVDAFPPRVRRAVTIVTLLISVFVCAILCWFCFKAARQLWEYDDVTMTPPYFKTWPSGASIAIGYGLLAGRMFLQALGEINPRRFADDVDERDRILHRSE